MRIVYTLIIVCCIAVVVSCSRTQSELESRTGSPSAFLTATETEIVSSEAAWSKIRSGALTIDVRSPEEYANGHLDGAINIPYQQLAEKLPQKEKNKARDIVVYCGSGRRARIAQAELHKLGYEHVVNAGAFSNLIKERP